MSEGLFPISYVPKAMPNLCSKMSACGYILSIKSYPCRTIFMMLSTNVCASSSSSVVSWIRLNGFTWHCKQRRKQSTTHTSTSLEKSLRNIPTTLVASVLSTLRLQNLATLIVMHPFTKKHPQRDVFSKLDY